jgi:hypothetical protein
MMMTTTTATAPTTATCQQLGTQRWHRNNRTDNSTVGHQQPQMAMATTRADCLLLSTSDGDTTSESTSQWCTGGGGGMISSASSTTGSSSWMQLTNGHKSTSDNSLMPKVNNAIAADSFDCDAVRINVDPPQGMCTFV